MSFLSCTTMWASRFLVPLDTSGLSMSGPTIDRCMLNARAVEAQPWASSSAASEYPSKPIPAPPSSVGMLSA